jgi:hypothetical protein
VFLAARQYDVDETVGRLERLRLDRSGTAELVRILRTGATRGRAPVPGAGETSRVAAEPSAVERPGDG